MVKSQGQAAEATNCFRRGRAFDSVEAVALPLQIMDRGGYRLALTLTRLGQEAPLLTLASPEIAEDCKAAGVITFSPWRGNLSRAFPHTLRKLLITAW